jgi:hypothetical protein
MDGAPGTRRLDGEGESIPRIRKNSLWARLTRWLEYHPVPRSQRFALPGLVAYHWSGGHPQALEVGDISRSGIFLLTEERWYPGTVLRVTLQREGSLVEHGAESLATLARVVRWNPEGVGLAFVFKGSLDLPHDLTATGATAEELDLFLRRMGLVTEEESAEAE